MFDKKKILILSIFILFILISPDFAYDDINETVMLETSQDNDILSGSNDYYFNASAENDNGDGSINSPYKYLTAERIKANSNIHLANGEYVLDKSKTIEQVNIIGSDAEKTIIKYNDISNPSVFTVWNSLTLQNLTICDTNIENYVKLNATNTIFTGGYGNKPDSYGNNFGGAIYCPYYSEDYTAIVNIKNCTFIDNYAEYGGAIYMDGGKLSIDDSTFINNYAYNFGGAIAGEYYAEVKISNSKFYNSRSIADAGGTIYLRDCELTLEKTDIINSSATFGGAIASLNTAFSSNYLTVENSTAKWDGGAVYHMYNNFTSFYGKFQGNSAKNGGALFIDNSTSPILRSNTFTNNNASFCAGAIYSLCNNLKTAPLKRWNGFSGNTAMFKNDEYELSSINLTIADGNYTMYKTNETIIDEIPQYYSLLDHGLLTIPKDQQSSGNCWAFTAIAALESAILKASGESFDLSEENMKNVIAKFSDYGWDISTNDGGYDNMPFGYLASWLGPVLESEDTFDDKGTLSAVFESIMHVQNIKFLTRKDYLDNDEVKKAILKYGAVGTSMLFDNNFFKGEGYYCWSFYSSNHAVTIVGWDDNYSRDNFYGLPEDKGDGAWIVRNSWGPDWNDNGYFYVSYYDEKLAQPGVDNSAYVFVLNDTMKYDRNYQYDIAGRTDNYYGDFNEIWYKNLFTAQSDEYLSAISTYFEKTTNWSAKITVNGEVKLIKNSTSDAGYYTLDLGEMIPLKTNDTFEVELKVTATDSVSMPISEEFSLNKMIYTPGISYFSLDGINWIDLFNHTARYATHRYSSQVACIKAFTRLSKVNTQMSLNVTKNEKGAYDIIADIADEYGNLLNNGNVTFTIDGKNYVVNVSNGIATLDYNFNQKSNIINAIFDATGYNTSFVCESINLPDLIILNVDIEQYENDVNITVSSEDKLNATIELLLNGQEFIADFINGINTFALTLKNDDYCFEVFLINNTQNIAYTNGSFVVDVKQKANLNISVRNITYGENAVIIVDYNELAEGNLTVSVNDTAYELINKTIIISALDAGDYIINATFRYDNPEIESEEIIREFTVTPAINNVVVSANNTSLPENVTICLISDVCGNYTVNIGGNIINIAVDNLTGKGFASIYLAKGKYTTVTSGENRNYVLNVTEAEFEVKKSSIQISVNADNICCGEELVVNISTASDISRRISVIVGNESKFVTLKNGSGSAKFSGLSKGTYTVTASYNGDDNYLKTSANTTVKVTRGTASITITANSIRCDENLVVNVTMPKDVTRRALVSVDGVSKYVSFKNVTGSVTFSSLSVGTHEISVSYDGDENYLKSSANATVKVTRGLALIKATAKAVSYGEDLTVDITMPSDVTRRVKVTIGETSKYVSLKDGKGSVKFSNLASGKHNITISYDGDANYLKSTLNITAKVNKATPDIQIKANDIKQGETLTVEVKLPEDVTRRALVTIDGQSKYASLKNGCGNVKFSNLEAGNHQIKVSYDGDANYKASSNSTKIEVKSL